MVDYQQYTLYNYFDQNSIVDEELFYGSLAGMIGALGDAYSLFLNPDNTADFTQELNGTFYGIGAEIGKRNGFLLPWWLGSFC